MKQRDRWGWPAWTGRGVRLGTMWTVEFKNGHFKFHRTSAEALLKYFEP